MPISGHKLKDHSYGQLATINCDYLLNILPTNPSTNLLLIIWPHSRFAHRRPRKPSLLSLGRSSMPSRAYSTHTLHIFGTLCIRVPFAFRAGISISSHCIRQQVNVLLSRRKSNAHIDLMSYWRNQSSFIELFNHVWLGPFDVLFRRMDCMLQWHRYLLWPVATAIIEERRYTLVHIRTAPRFRYK